MRQYIFLILLIISCSISDKFESDMEVKIYDSLLEYLQSEYEGKKFVLSPTSELATVGNEVVVTDSLGTILDYHWITWVYKEWSKYSDSLNFNDLKNNYVLNNENQIRLKEYFEPITLDTLSLKNYKAMFHKDVRLDSLWMSFNTQYPETNGYLLISRPGFSENKNWSIIYYERQHNSTGAGYFVLLKKIGSKWKVVESFVNWEA